MTIISYSLENLLENQPNRKCHLQETVSYDSSRDRAGGWLPLKGVYLEGTAPEGSKYISKIQNLNRTILSGSVEFH